MSHHNCKKLLSCGTPPWHDGGMYTLPVSWLYVWCQGFIGPRKWTILTSLPNLQDTLHQVNVAKTLDSMVISLKENDRQHCSCPVYRIDHLSNTSEHNFLNYCNYNIVQTIILYTGQCDIKCNGVMIDNTVACLSTR